MNKCYESTTRAASSCLGSKPPPQVAKQTLVPRKAVCCKKCKHLLLERRGERTIGRTEGGRQRKKTKRMTASKARGRVGGSSSPAFTADCTRFWIETGLMVG